MFNAFPAPVFDATSAAGGTGDFGDLPEWDLSDLYPAPDAPEFARDMEWLEKACADFASEYEGKLADLDAAGLLKCVQEYEAISTTGGRLMSFAGLRYYQNTVDAERAQFMQNAQEKVTVFTAPLVFYSLEINRIEDDKLDAMLAENTDLARYKPIFEQLRAMKPYQLSDELEKFLHDQSSVGASAWNKLFDETIAGLMFTVDGTEMNLESTLNLLTEQDRSKREAATRELARVFGENVKLFSRVHNTLAKEKAIEDQWRKMPTPQT
ncbi:MAG TPA: oligoendopeptidase F, partial [Rhodobacteraceae bacterium]|nr:oligoendopeptidase F [Paracoccaceae bacterium]